MIKISDERWHRIQKYFPEEKIPGGRPGRKPVPARQILDAVLWILTTGAQWAILPQSYPNHKMVHRRFQKWCKQEILRNLLKEIVNELRESGKSVNIYWRNTVRGIDQPTGIFQPCQTVVMQ